MDCHEGQAESAAYRNFLNATEVSASNMTKRGYYFILYIARHLGFFKQNGSETGSVSIFKGGQVSFHVMAETPNFRNILFK
jgi:hypothetical protein